ncbi:MAG: hypothetical protein RL148_85 [Planctomycetota bacterium]|jgi:hypothetical protein
MENDVFLRPAVAGVLKQKFVEARMHVDIQSSLTAGQFADNKARQQELAGSYAMPFFVIVDPRTGAKLRATGLSGGPGNWEPLFLEFLNGTPTPR